MQTDLPLYVFSFCAIVISILQVGLICGAPWGEWAMGGKYPGKFPPKLRVSAFIQLCIILFALLIVLIRGNVFLITYFELSRSAVWFVVTLFGISSILNTITSSKKERILGAPVTISMLVSSLIIALS